MSSIDQLRENITSVFMGNLQAVDRLITCLLARGHVLIEDVPGVGLRQHLLLGDRGREAVPGAPPACVAARFASSSAWSACL